MASRLDLQTKLEGLLGNRNVYYQPPSNFKMEYPCIRYSKKDVDKKSADDRAYISTTSYEIIVIDKRPDNTLINQLLELPMCSYDRHYNADNLNHDVLTLYF